MLDDAAWLALTAVLTVLGALWTVRQGRRHGSAAAVRGVAITLLPPAALLTGTLRLGTRIVDAVVDWIKVSHWPAFNLADSAITLGVVSLLVVLERGHARDPA